MGVLSENSRASKINLLPIFTFGLGIFVLLPPILCGLVFFAQEWIDHVGRKLPSGWGTSLSVYILFGDIPVGIFSLIVGILARKRFKSNPTQKGKSMATFAIIIGIFGEVFSLSLRIFVWLAARLMGN